MFTPSDRAQAGRHAEDLYHTGLSIRQIAKRLDVSYGFARTLLIERDVTLRPTRGAEPPSENRSSRAPATAPAHPAPGLPAG